jgi:hypothetical protein
MKLKFSQVRELVVSYLDNVLPSIYFSEKRLVHTYSLDEYLSRVQNCGTVIIPMYFHFQSQKEQFYHETHIFPSEISELVSLVS